MLKAELLIYGLLGPTSPDDGDENTIIKIGFIIYDMLQSIPDKYLKWDTPFPVFREELLTQRTKKH